MFYWRHKNVGIGNYRILHYRETVSCSLQELVNNTSERIMYASGYGSCHIVTIIHHSTMAILQTRHVMNTSLHLCLIASSPPQCTVSFPSIDSINKHTRIDSIIKMSFRNYVISPWVQITSS